MLLLEKSFWLNDFQITGSWLQSVYKTFSSSIERHLEREVKKRGAERLNWDASYKEPRNLARYHAQSVFKALITATNDQGEIRVQFHVVTDGHDQFHGPIAELIKTLNAYGQVHPQLLCTDNPAGDNAFFKSVFQSLADKQAAFDSLAALAPAAATPPPQALGPDSFSLLECTSHVNRAVEAMHSYVRGLGNGDRLIAIDAEWDVTFDSRGMVTLAGMVKAQALLGPALAADTPAAAAAAPDAPAAAAAAAAAASGAAPQVSPSPLCAFRSARVVVVALVFKHEHALRAAATRAVWAARALQ